MRRCAGTAVAVLAWWLLSWAALAGTAPAARAVQFTSADGGQIHGTVYGDGARGVVLAHGGRYDQTSWQPQAVHLADAGFQVLTFDFRGRGRSVAGSGGPEAVAEDVLAAVHWLKRHGADRVSIVGASFGGGAAAEAATRLPADALDALVLLAHSPIAHPERMTGRKLFVLARDDYQGEARTPRRPSLRAQFDAAPGPKTWLEFDGDAHAQALFATPQGEAVLAAIVDFLAG